MGLNTAESSAIDARREKAWDLRVNGHSLRSIAQQLEVSLGTAHNDIHAVLERTQSEANEDARRHMHLQLARLDKAIAVVMRRIEQDGDDALEAIDKLDKLEKRKAALLGLDAPEKHEHDVNANVGPSASEANRLIREKFGQHATKPEGDDG